MYSLHLSFFPLHYMAGVSIPQTTTKADKQNQIMTIIKLLFSLVLEDWTLRAGTESWNDVVGKYLMAASHSMWHDSSTSVKFQSILYHLCWECNLFKSHRQCESGNSPSEDGYTHPIPPSVSAESKCTQQGNCIDSSEILSHKAFELLVMDKNLNLSSSLCLGHRTNL